MKADRGTPDQDWSGFFYVDQNLLCKTSSPHFPSTQLPHSFPPSVSVPRAPTRRRTRWLRIPLRSPMVIVEPPKNQIAHAVMGQGKCRVVHVPFVRARESASPQQIARILRPPACKRSSVFLVLCHERSRSSRDIPQAF